MKNIQIQKRKGMSINDMYPSVLIIVLVGIVLGVGLFTLSTFRINIATDYSGTQDGINTSAGSTTLTDAALTNFNASTMSVEFTNGTDLTVVTDYNYTGAGVLTWSAGIAAQNGTSLVNTTYTYNYDATSSPEAATSTVITGLATFADWIAIIVVVIAAAIVLGIVISSFGAKRNRI